VKARADGGSIYAQDRHATLYLEGKGVPKDPKAGVNLLNTAAQGGYVWSQYSHGSIFEKCADGVQPHAALEARYYEMAAAQAEANSMYALGRMYAAGNGVARDGARAVDLLERSGAGGAVYAYAALGDLYANGDGVPQDDVEAVRWYREGAQHGDGTALLRLANAHEAGRGVPQDPAGALMWYILAGQQDGKGAADQVARLTSELDPASVSQAEDLAAAWRRGNL
jgi:TPR repeat protein